MGTDIPSNTLPETKSLQLKRWHPQKEKFIFQPSIFEVLCLLVSGKCIRLRVGFPTPPLPESLDHGFHLWRTKTGGQKSTWNILKYHETWKSKETYVKTFWLLLAFERSVFDDNIWQQLDYSLQLNNSRKGTWSAAFTITVIIEFLRTHEGRVDCKKAVPMALFKHDCSPHLHCIHPPAQGWHWACFKWSRNKLRAKSSWLLHHDFGGPNLDLHQNNNPLIIVTTVASGAADGSLGNSSSMCDGVTSRLGYFFGESGVFSKDLFLWKQLLLYSGSCGYLSPRF